MNEVREYLLKRFLDASLALLLIILTMPMFVLLAIAVWIEDRASVLHRQEVIGKKGKSFNLLRFRTLQPGVDKIFKGDLVKEDDPGTTRVGRFMLTVSLDSLPMLWNVLRGHMSFVGPRPDTTETAAYYTRRLPRYNHRHLVRPGLVSLASLYGEDGMAASQRLKYDLFYLDKMSFTWDARLLLGSAWRGFRGRIGLDEEVDEERV